MLRILTDVITKILVLALEFPADSLLFKELKRKKETQEEHRELPRAAVRHSERNYEATLSAATPTLPLYSR